MIHKLGFISQLVNSKFFDGINNNTKYYIRTKDQSVVTKHPPDWIKKPRSIELLVLGREVSSQYDPPGKLLTGAGQITQHAQELLENLKTNEHIKNLANIVLVSNALEVVALLNKHCFVAPPILHNDLEGVGFTTSLFASLTYELETARWIDLTEKDDIDGDALTLGGTTQTSRSVIEQKLGSVIDNARKYARVPRPESLRSAPIVPARAPTITANRPVEIKGLGVWDDICKEWKGAKNTGIIHRLKDGKVEKWLDVWRGETVLPNYVACIKKKREAIGQIWKTMLPVGREGDVRRHVSILLQADPGAGKTFLAQKLAENLGFEVVSHDITQMIHRDDLLSFFDTIATRQAEKSNKPLLVFVDEINATLDGDPVYGAFLAPIEGAIISARG